MFAAFQHPDDGAGCVAEYDKRAKRMTVRLEETGEEIVSREGVSTRPEATAALMLDFGLSAGEIDWQDES